MPHRKKMTARKRLAMTKLALSVLLPFCAGAINASAFSAVGSYISHITGHVTNISRDIILGQTENTLFEVMFVLCFFLGAIVCTSFIFRARLWTRGRHVHALLIEAAVVCLYAFSPLYFQGESGRIVMTALLCLAMGIQNALVTQAFGAVLRTTHLTGMFTDLGIEVTRLAFWLRGARHNLDTAKVSIWTELSREPEWTQLRTHWSIIMSFSAGALAGSYAYWRVGSMGLFPITWVILGLAVYDWRHGIKRLDL
jgi:uncharacterized membrane protein YoaK (UPF0700 family)